MPLIRVVLAFLLLMVSVTAHAQQAPGNVVTPAPTPREGTVGPEQLRDFSLPGTRTAPPPTAEEPPAPPPPSPATTRAEPTVRQAPPAAANTPGQSDEQREERGRGEARPDAPALTARPALPITPPAADVTVGLGPPVPEPEAVAPVVQTPTFEPDQSARTGLGFWPWLVLAALAGIALALVMGRRQRRRVVAAGPGTPDEWTEREPTGRSRSQPLQSPRDQPAELVEPEPTLPAGLVTTRLRRSPPLAPALDAPPLPAGLVSTCLRSPARPSAPPPSGAVVSTGLRPWLDLDLAMSELVVTGSEAMLRFRLSILNSGMATARDVAIEALALNAGDEQAAEIANFFARPDGAEVGMAELPRLQSGELTHQIRMPRTAIREYDVGGRRVFVPLLAFNAGYRWASGTGRTSAAFLIGHEQPGSDRLAPLAMRDGSFRVASLGIRRLDDQIRR